VALGIYKGGKKYDDYMATRKNDGSNEGLQRNQEPR
jgi:hypothetical protein